MKNINNILITDNILKYLKRGSIKAVNAGKSAPNPSNNSEKVSANTLGALYKKAASKQANIRPKTLKKEGPFLLLRVLQSDSGER
jgi:hypothetical protein